MSTLLFHRSGLAHELLRHLDLERLGPQLQRGLLADDMLQESSRACWELSGGSTFTAASAIPAGDIAARMRVAGHTLQVLATELGAGMPIDGSGLLAQRAKMTTGNFAPTQGKTLRGHGTMLRTANGWVALNLPRPEDLEMLPALSSGHVEPGDLPGLAGWVRGVPSAHLVETAGLLAVPAAQLPTLPLGDAPQQRQSAPWTVQDLGALRTQRLKDLRVVDLTGLWAGPLCTSLLARAGAQVVRLQGTGRLHVAADHDREFTASLARGIEILRLDLFGKQAQELMSTADVVVTSSRPEALQRLGITPRDGTIWLRITAHGSHGENALRVGFGDDAAVAAGAVAYTPSGPTFAADALADPVTGLLGALAVFGSIVRGRAALLDLSLSGSARWALGPALGLGAGHDVALRKLLEAAWWRK